MFGFEGCKGMELELKFAEIFYSKIKYKIDHEDSEYDSSDTDSD